MQVSKSLIGYQLENMLQVLPRFFQLSGHQDFRFRMPRDGRGAGGYSGLDDGPPGMQGCGRAGYISLFIYFKIIKNNNIYFMQVWWGGNYAIIGSSDFFYVFTLKVAPSCDAAGPEPCTLAVWSKDNDMETLTTNSTCQKM